MTFIALLASSLLLSSAASAQAATRYDLNCKNKVTVMRIGSTTRETVSSPKRLSIDLAAKLRSEEHTSELQSLMRISYAVFCLKKKNTTNTPYTPQQQHTNT